MERTELLRRPMLKWRCGVFLMLGASFLGDMGWLGFHPAKEPQDTIILVGAVLLWSICDAVDAIHPRSEHTNGDNNG